jgi:hypothetical protein
MSQLSPLDLLSLSDAEQDIIRHLNRYPNATISDLAVATHLPINNLETVINKMINSAWLVERYEEGNRWFIVQYRQDTGRSRSKSSSMLDLF